MGTVLRAYPFLGSPNFNYSYLLHGHSHLAFLGWVFNAFFAIGLILFIRESSNQYCRRLFVALQVSNLGMLIAFPLQGYAAWSIAFSTLHLICAALFVLKLWKSHAVSQGAKPYLRSAILFMLLSNLGPFALGPLAALEMRDSPWYTLSIYFYMHFQYNGWFIFFLMATLLQRLPDNSPLQACIAKAFPWLLIGTLLTFAQSALWTTNSIAVNLLSLIGSLAQVIACAVVFSCRHKINTELNRIESAVSRLIIRCVLVLFIAKIGMQFAASLPGLDHFAIDRFAAIGYMHLVFLGIVTPTLFVWAIENDWLSSGRFLNAALPLFALGVALTEIVLIYTPLATYSAWPQFPYRELFLAIASLIISLSLAAMLPALLKSAIRR